MPGFDGLELVRGVRSLDPRAPTVLMTGYGTESIREGAARSGVGPCLEKPFEMQGMLLALHQLLAA
jgi:FixJ family two-component response regulator